MPTRQEFLGAVLPPEGIYCVVGIKGKVIHSQTFHRTLLDVDVAVETSELTRNNILMQAGTAILQQANSIPKMALSLLQNA